MTTEDIDFKTITPTDLMTAMIEAVEGTVGSFEWIMSEKRYEFCSAAAWAVPTEGALQAIIKHAAGRKILEVGAGLGLWASLLSDRGANIVATDISVTKMHKITSHHQAKDARRFFDVQQMKHHKAMKNHANAEMLFLCWPPYDTSMAKLALRAFKGNTFAYIGEDQYGCTGDEKFHDDVYKYWVMTEAVDIPQWRGIHDRLNIYRRK